MSGYARCCSDAITRANSNGSIGFRTHAANPDSSSAGAEAVSATTGIASARARTWSSSAKPSWPGMAMSVTITCGVRESDHAAEFVAEYEKRTPLGRMAVETDYDGAIVFLASPASAYMTGATLVVDGGWTAR